MSRSGPPRKLALRLVVLAGAVAVTSITYLDFCDLVFACGCRAPWLGAAQACNIHQPQGPHCPWCSFGFWGGAVPFSSIVATQAAAMLWPGPGHLGIRLGTAALALPLVGGLAAAAFGLATGYWQNTM